MEDAMTDKVTKALLEELALLRAKLEQTEIYKEIQILERMIARRQVQHDSATSEDQAFATLSTGGAMRPRPAPISQIKARVEAMLKGVKFPVSTKEIYTSLEAEGIIVPGEKPQNNLSAHLSRDTTFISWGRSGWTLAHEITPQTELIESIVNQYVGSLSTSDLNMLMARLKGTDEERTEARKQMFQAALEKLGRNLVTAEEDAGYNVVTTEASRRGSTDLSEVLAAVSSNPKSVFG
jgi:hypothetical protein